MWFKADSTHHYSKERKPQHMVWVFPTNLVGNKFGKITRCKVVQAIRVAVSLVTAFRATHSDEKVS